MQLLVRRVFNPSCVCSYNLHGRNQIYLCNRRTIQQMVPMKVARNHRQREAILLIKEGIATKDSSRWPVAEAYIYIYIYIHTYGQFSKLRHGRLLGTLNKRCRLIIRTPKETIF